MENVDKPHARAEGNERSWAAAIDRAYKEAKEGCVSRDDLHISFPVPDGVDEDHYIFQAYNHMRCNDDYSDDLETCIEKWKQMEDTFVFVPEVVAKECTTCKRLVERYADVFEFGEDGVVYCRRCRCAAHLGWMEPCREGGECCCDFEHCQVEHIE